MPTYCYETDAGDVVERVYPMGKAPGSISFDGKVARRSFAAERKGMPAKSGWPMTCFASGVNASQAQELRDHFVKCGVPTEVTSDGDPIYRDPAHRKKALKVRGMVDKLSYV